MSFRSYPPAGTSARNLAAARLVGARLRLNRELELAALRALAPPASPATPAPPARPHPNGRP